jgi:Lipid A 3-O-deacylase (PagL)
VRKETRWLALVLVGACGTAASAQSPLMYGMQPYPPYPYASPQPAPPAYYPQPQPRVMYVPATAAPWTYPAPTAPNVAPSARAPADSGAAGNSKANSDTGELLPAPKRKIPAKPASLYQGDVEEFTGPMYGDPYAGPAVSLPDDDINVLPKGRWNLQALGGVYSDIGAAHYNWAQTNLRLGKILGTGCLDHLHGAFEFLFDFNGAATTQSDFGSWFIGGGLLLRYNFVHPGSFLVPYVQGGVGFQYNDAFRDPTQPFLGSHIELTGQAQVGLRFHICKNLSLDVEGGLIHISDLGMSTRDEGINALGGSAGLTYYFPCGRH